MAELGAGGGKGDLDQQHELEVGDTSALGMLMSLCATKMQDQPKLLSSVMEMLASIMRDPVRAIALDFASLHPERPGEDQENITDFEEMPLDSLIPALVSLAAKAGEQGNGDATTISAGRGTNLKNQNANLPKQIVSPSPSSGFKSHTDKPAQTFPYSRHSSYEELCWLIEAFKPKDIWPCTVDKVNWSAAQSMSFLFGHLYETPCKFTHDQAMFRKEGGDVSNLSGSESKLPGDNREQIAGTDANHEREARSSSSDVSLQHRSNAATSHARSRDQTRLAYERDSPHAISTPDHITKKRRRSDRPSESEYAVPSDQAKRNTANTPALKMSSTTSNIDPPTLSPYECSEAWKQQAFEAARGTGSSNWNDITLVSVSGHQECEKEL